MTAQNNNKQTTKNTANKKPENKLLKQLPREIGGVEGRPEPTRYGDWEKQGRCIDF